MTVGVGAIASQAGKSAAGMANPAMAMGTAGAKNAGGLVADHLGDGKRQMGGMAETAGEDYFRDRLSGKDKKS